MDAPFEEALAAMKNGSAVSRRGWPGGTWAYIIPPTVRISQGLGEKLFGEYAMVPHSGYLAKKASDNIVEVWLPDTRDILARDWYIVIN